MIKPCCEFIQKKLKKPEIYIKKPPLQPGNFSPLYKEMREIILRSTGTCFNFVLTVLRLCLCNTASLFLADSDNGFPANEKPYFLTNLNLKFKTCRFVVGTRSTGPFEAVIASTMCLLY
jgi:hypothetical protein